MRKNSKLNLQTRSPNGPRDRSIEIIVHVVNMKTGTKGKGAASEEKHDVSSGRQCANKSSMRHYGNLITR